MYLWTQIVHHSLVATTKSQVPEMLELRLVIVLSSDLIGGFAHQRRRLPQLHREAGVRL